ncbi:MAG: peptidylprolyl isomerase [Flavobacteriales bacterium]
MAVLEKIRNRSGLLIVLVGLALLAFILTDLVSGSNVLFGRSLDVGEINGVKISAQEFNEKFVQYEENVKNASGTSNIDENTRQQIVDQIWNELIDKHVFSVQHAKAGVAVSPAELFDMIAGNNVDQQVSNIPIFKDSITGEFSKDKVLDFLRNRLTEEADPDGRMRKNWIDFEEQLKKSRMKTKYANLVKKSMYYTTLQARRDFTDKNDYATFRLIAQNLDVIPDTTVKLTDEDFKTFYNERKHEYEQAEETRRIEYVVFNVAPSPQDREAVVNSMQELVDEFKNAENDSAFVFLNSDEPSFGDFIPAAKIPPVISDAAVNGSVGNVLGPYFEDNFIKIAKIVAFKAMSDSVKARHILISTQNGLDMATAMRRADSLKSEVKKGKNFADLARRFSDDPGSKENGGDLGWFTEGMMVPTFNDACFNGKAGDLVTVESPYGAHLINILEKTRPRNKVKLAEVKKRITASSETESKVYYNADEFAGNANNYQTFKKLAEEKNYYIVPYDGLRISDRRINDLQESRELVRWAFDEKTRIGDVSKVFSIGDVFVVGSLVNVKSKGIPPLDQMKTTIEPAVIKWKKGKQVAEKFAQAASGATDMEAIASKLNLQVEDGNRITYASYSIPNYGYEPKVLGNAFGLALNKISAPIIGNNAVFIIQVTARESEGEKPENWDDKKKQLSNNARFRVDGLMNQALTKKANIVDNRARFF